MQFDMLLKKSKFRYPFMTIAAFTTISLLISIYYSGFLAPGSSSHLNTEYRDYISGKLTRHIFSENNIDKEYDLDFEDEDVIVFLHIQKTGGTTFGRHLVKNLNIGLKKPCVCHKRRKRCDCLTDKKHIWLFSRYSTGWACGLHADWTELKNCVEDAMNDKENVNRKRRYHYITILRDPVARYLSEWHHVMRGATWKAAALKCNGREASLKEVPFCYTGDDWSGVTLDEFLACKYNLANNRQVRMLSNLSKINCYNGTGLSEEERNEKMLESAKENLLDLAFYGITEYQRYVQFLFEHTFKLHFKKDFYQINTTHSSKITPTPEQMEKIRELNKYDILLYQFAKDLFLQRVEMAQNETGVDVLHEAWHVESEPEDNESIYKEMAEDELAWKRSKKKTIRLN